MDSHFKFWITNKGTFRRGLQCPLFCTLDLGLPRWVPYIVNLQTRIKQQGRKCKYILLGSDTLLVNKNYKQINWLALSRHATILTRRHGANKPVLIDIGNGFVKTVQCFVVSSFKIDQYKIWNADCGLWAGYKTRTEV